jgi:hypothetical protein
VNFLHPDDPVPSIGRLRYDRSGIDISFDRGSVVDLTPHNMDDYLADTLLLIERANEQPSIFYNTAEATALRTGDWSSTSLNDFGVVVGTDQGDAIFASAQDDWILGGPGDDNINWVLSLAMRNRRLDRNRRERMWSQSDSLEDY